MPVLGSGQQVLADYEDNGQIDGCYTLADFEDALKRIRPDQQQYGAAVDVIRQAELTNIRRPDGACGGTSAAGASADTTADAASGTEAADDGGGLSGVVIGIIVAAALAVVAFVLYLAIGRKGGDGGDAAA